MKSQVRGQCRAVQTADTSSWGRVMRCATSVLLIGLHSAPHSSEWAAAQRAWGWSLVKPTSQNFDPTRPTSPILFHIFEKGIHMAARPKPGSCRADAMWQSRSSASHA